MIAAGVIRPREAESLTTIELPPDRVVLSLDD